MDIPRELVEQFARGSGVIFVGAGLSQGAGLPSWSELLSPLADSIGLPSRLRADPLKIAQHHYENACGRQALTSHITEQTDTSGWKTFSMRMRSRRELVSLEQACLSLLRAYDRDEVTVDKVLKTVLRYSRLNGDTKDRRANYGQTLRDHPWRSCPCEICQDIFKSLSSEVMTATGDAAFTIAGYSTADSVLRERQMVE